MIRDMIDCLLIGGMVSFKDIWIIEDTADQIVIAIGAAVLIYMGILFFRGITEWIKKYLRKSSKPTGRW